MTRFTIPQPTTPLQRKSFRQCNVEHLLGPKPSRCIDNGTYVIEAYKFPSITSVLSLLSADDIEAWKERTGRENAERISRQSTVRGKSFHSRCETYLTNHDAFRYDYNPLQHQLFINTLEYLNNIDDIFLIERPIWSKHLRMAGTPDCIAKYDNKLSIIDFKTAKNEKKKDWIESYFMQAAGYAVMFEERTKIPVANLVIIVAIEGMPTQVFKEKRDNWIKPLLACRDKYEEILGLDPVPVGIFQ